MGGPVTEPPSITCPACGMRSFHPMDIRERFCGRCDAWHDDMPQNAEKGRTGRIADPTPLYLPPRLNQR